jgi:hypothetical protein
MKLSQEAPNSSEIETLNSTNSKRRRSNTERNYPCRRRRTCFPRSIVPDIFPDWRPRVRAATSPISARGVKPTPARERAWRRVPAGTARISAERGGHAVHAPQAASGEGRAGCGEPLPFSAMDPPLWRSARTEKREAKEDWMDNVIKK